jgi:DNA polymerase type B, organellar and viral
LSIADIASRSRLAFAAMMFVCIAPASATRFSATSSETPMPAKSPEAIARKRARDAERRKADRLKHPKKWKAIDGGKNSVRAAKKVKKVKKLKSAYEKRMDKIWGEREATVQAVMRHFAPPSIKAKRAREAERRQALSLGRPFIGCDGEGVSRDGGHDYVYFRMGKRELYRGGRRLSTGEILTFILNAPLPRSGVKTLRPNKSTPIYVGYYFNYDVTKILADVPWKPNRRYPDSAPPLIRIFSREIERDAKGRAEGKDANHWTTFSIAGVKFAVDYLPGHYFSVRRPGVKGSTRTIIDVAANFQRSFLSALKLYKIAPEAWERIDHMKQGRGGFEIMTPEIKSYCAEECEYLAELMTQHRADRHANGIFCNNFDGPGSVAAYWFKQEGMTQFRNVAHRFPKELIRLAHAGYYGGRFETSRRGLICEAVYEHDLNSAYPAGLQHVPCIDHGRWRKAEPAALRGVLDRGDLFVAPVKFDHPARSFWCGLPFRSKGGSLSWPRNGQGVYWSIEIASAIALGANIEFAGPGYVYERKCDCKPFGWLALKYAQRIALGKDLRGWPLKIGINSAYGKTAQRIGVAPWQNPFYAGIATAWTRAQINLAIASASDPRSIVMVATDAVYSAGAPLPLEISDRLGAWGRKQFSSLFVVQPGLYWPPRTEVDDDWKLKTRGISRKFFEDKTDLFEAAWRDYLDAPDDLARARLDPCVRINPRLFVGFRLAIAQGRPERAGTWEEFNKDLKFGFKTKRRLGEREDRCEVLYPLAGDRLRQSLCYTPEIPEWKAAADDFFRARSALIFEAMPDFVDRSTPID